MCGRRTATRESRKKRRRIAGQLPIELVACTAEEEISSGTRIGVPDPQFRFVRAAEVPSRNCPQELAFAPGIARWRLLGSPVPCSMFAREIPKWRRPKVRTHQQPKPSWHLRRAATSTTAHSPPGFHGFVFCCITNFVHSIPVKRKYISIPLHCAVKLGLLAFIHGHGAFCNPVTYLHRHIDILLRQSDIRSDFARWRSGPQGLSRPPALSSIQRLTIISKMLGKMLGVNISDRVQQQPTFRLLNRNLNPRPFQCNDGANSGFLRRNTRRSFDNLVVGRQDVEIS